MSFKIKVWMQVIILLCSCYGLRAELIKYSSEYVPTALPTAAKGTPQHPRWTLQQDKGSMASVSDGVLIVDTLSAKDANALCWKIGRKSGHIFGDPSDSWNGSSVTGSTIDFRIKVSERKDNERHESYLAGGFQVVVCVKSGVFSLSFSPEDIVVKGLSTTFVRGHDNSKWRTFRIVVSDGRLSLYDSNEGEPLISEIEPEFFEGYEYLSFGDASSLVSGRFELSFLGWTNQTSEFSPPPEDPLRNRQIDED